MLPSSVTAHQAPERESSCVQRLRAACQCCGAWRIVGEFSFFFSEENENQLVLPGTSPHPPPRSALLLVHKGKLAEMEMGRAETQEKTPLSKPVAGKTDWAWRGYRVHQVAAFILHVAYIMGGEEVPFQTPQ